MIHRHPPTWTHITGYLVGDTRRVDRIAAPVASRLPHDEYQGDLGEFRAVLNSVIQVEARKRTMETNRGPRSWIEAVEINPRDTIYIDVTECNHVPMDVRGWKDCDDIRAYWRAWLISVERIDGDPSQPCRVVAGYRVDFDSEEGRG